MTTKKKAKGKSEAMSFLEELAGGPLTVGKMLESHRLGKEITQTEFAEVLGVSQSHLCDMEKGRKLVSPERAMRFAQTLGLHEKHWIKVAVDDYLRSLNIPYRVQLEDAA